MSKFLQLAPMQAMTDIFFMNTYNEMFGGFDEMMAPYILASAQSKMKVQKLTGYFSELDKTISLVPQLLSNDADAFLYFANTLYDAGYKKINWNLGCPFPFVTKKQRGAGLLPHPDIIDNLLDDIMKSLKSELSVKVRLGLYEDSEIDALIPVLNRYDISELIIHPRTAEQKYTGKANIKRFTEVYNAFNMPIIYNGDIVSAHQVEVIEEQVDIKGYMIGRGAFINPFITRQIKGVFEGDDKKEQYKEFYFRLHNYYKGRTKNDEGFLSRMKELWFYFSQSFEKGDSYLFALRIINDITAFERVVNNIFDTGVLKY